MKKILLNIILLIPVLVFGQSKPSGFDFVWKGAFQSSDSTLIDSITGVGNSNYKVIDMDWSGDSIPISTQAKLKIYNDTIEMQRLFGGEIRNFNAADTLYFKISEKIVNADTVTSHAYISEIAHYPSPTTDDDNYFNATPVSATGLDVGTGKTYTNPATATTNANDGDTIYLYDVDYVGSINPSTKNLTYIGVGNSKLSNSGAVIYANLDIDSLRLKSISLESGTSFVVYSATSANLDIENCVISTPANGISKVTGDSDTCNIIGNKIYGRVDLYGFINSEDNYYQTLTYNIRAYDKLILDNDYYEGASVSIMLSNSAPDTMISKNCYFNEKLLSNSGFNFNSFISFYNCDFATSTNSVNINSSTYKTDMEFDKCNFINNGTGTQLFKQGAGDILINNCNYDSVNSVLSASSGGTATPSSMTFTNNTFNDSISEFGFQNYTCNIYNNSFKNLIFNVYNTDTNRAVDVYNNTFRNTDSVRYYYQGNVRFYDNTYTQDTGTTLIFLGDSLTVNNNFFDFGKLITFQGDLLDVITTDYFLFSGNKVIGDTLFGSHLFNTSCNTIVKNNYISNVCNGCVSKRTDLTDHIFEVFYNVFDSCGTPVYFRNMRKGKAYNNTFYNSYYRGDIFIDDNGGAQISDSCEIYNNISYNENEMYFLRFNTLNIADTLGLQCNNNIFATGVYRNDLSDTLTLSEWQALGFDQNSFDTDPNFKSATELWPTPPSNAIGKGFNIGEPYNVGLDITTTWPDNIVTKNQLGLWSIGAYIVPLSSNRGVILFDKAVIYKNKHTKM